MRKEKILLLYVFLSVLLTGCTTIDYRLYISEKTITESIDVTFQNTEDNRETIKYLKEDEQASYLEMNTNTTYYYKITDISSDEQLKLNYYFQYQDPVKLQNSNAVNMCYYNKSVVNNDGYLTISTSDQVTCMYKDTDKQFERLNIDIITDLEVVEHNADLKKGNHYIWQVTDQNYKKKPIYIQINTNKKQSTSLSAEERQGLFLLLGIVFGIIVIILIRVYSTYRRNNRFR